MSTRTLTSGAILIVLVVAFFVSGCYTQLARPGLSRDRVYEDDYYYEELDKAEEAEADTMVQQGHDVYVHDWYPYESWWYGWDPYYTYPMGSYWYWRHYNYWDPWYYGYAYWGDPWYWAPFSHYGGYAYYNTGYYYRPYSRYYLVDGDYYGKKRPFQRLDTFRDRTRLADTPRMTTVAAHNPGSMPAVQSRTRTAKPNETGKRVISRTAEPRSSGTVVVPRSNTVERQRNSKGQPPTIDRRVTSPKTKVKLESMESLRRSIERAQSSSRSRSSSTGKSTDSGISRSHSSSSPPPSISRSSGSSSRSSGSSSSGSSSGKSSGSSSSRTRVKKN